MKLQQSFDWCFLALLLSVLAKCFAAELPKELDAFLEKLFATEECEEFMADASFLSVGTSACAPFTCNFPHQLCMRPAASYGDEKANQCRDLPEKCLTAANGGVAVPRGAVPQIRPGTSEVRPNTENGFGGSETQTSIGGSSGGQNLTSASIENLEKPTENRPGSSFLQTRPPQPTGNKKYFGPICEQGVPEGRFCGFELKFAYNRETRSCDQFWYPGCPTENTNENLFGSLEQCRAATAHCAAGRGFGFGAGTQERRQGGNIAEIIGGGQGAKTIDSAHGGEGSEFFGGGNNIPEQIVSIGRSLSSKEGGMRGSGAQNVVNTFSQLLTGSALGGNEGGGNSGGAQIPAAGGSAAYGRSAGGPSEYGGGFLGNSGGGGDGGVTQPPNFIRLIANTIREVGASKNGAPTMGGGQAMGAKATASEFLNRFDPAQFASIFQSFG